jgi:hypothetical protein
MATTAAAVLVPAALPSTTEASTRAASRSVSIFPAR